MSSLLEIKNLSHTFSNGTEAIKDINISFEKSKFILIGGANGSGKTVLIRHFNGLLKPTIGRVLLEGEDIFKDIIKTRTKIGLVFQEPDTQFVGQTVKEDIAFGPENLQLSESIINQRVTASMEAVGLSSLAERRPYELSGGEKRKLAIAGVLAMHPDIIIFDEPFTGLDYFGVTQVLKELINLHELKKTIIVITHDLEKVIAHADRLIVLEKGQIVLDGIPEEVIQEVEKYGIRIPHGIDRDVKTMTWLK